MRRIRSAPLGFSLLEVVIAIVIAGLGLTALARVFAMGGRGLGDAKHMTEATLAGEERLEQLKAFDLDDPLLTAGAHRDTAAVAGASYVRIWTVQDDVPLAGMKRVRMQVFPSTLDTTDAVAMTAILGRR